MLVKLFNSIFEFPKKKLHYCSLMGCHESTTNGFNADVRKRWLIEARIGDDDESEVVNLCPAHIKEFFGLSESDYRALELGENLASGKISTEGWKNAISNLRG